MKQKTNSEQVRQRLEGYKITYLEKQTGLHYNTIRRFLLGADSKSSTVEKLSAWLESSQ